ncbi:MAG TPA: hypothetical protein VE869_00970 [Gemmatimonas sp.]|nr:hypothetical protein [Gemmatimonas sp.]
MQSRTTVGMLCTAIAMSAAVSASAHAQKAVPVRELAAVDAKTTVHFGNIFGVRPLAGGKVLVNDGIRRQLVMLDANLGNPTVVIDSVAEGGNSYGPRAAPLIPYLADSSLFVDGSSLSLLVIDPTGKVAHVMAAPKPSDLRFLAGGASGVDGQGNLVYRGSMTINRTNMRMDGPGGMPAMIQPPDSAPIVRANFDTRTVDTIGRVKIQSGSRVSMVQGSDGKMNAKMVVNPLPTIDEWAVLSDGSVAFVRGHDYHIDWIRPDGKAVSSAKLPFDWKRLTDDDKLKLIDSARTAIDKAQAEAKAAGASGGAAAAGAAMGAATGGGAQMEIRVMSTMGAAGGGGMSVGAPGGGAPGPMTNFVMPTPTVEFVPLNEIADYYPAIRSGAARPDMDGNLWILPTTSAQSKAGELVYDVVNNRGELTQRVRIPVGRSVAGFGRDGIVYLMYRDAAKGWFLERAKLGAVSTTN